MSGAKWGLGVQRYTHYFWQNPYIDSYYLQIEKYMHLFLWETWVKFWFKGLCTPIIYASDPPWAIPLVICTIEHGCQNGSALVHESICNSFNILLLKEEISLYILKPSLSEIFRESLSEFKLDFSVKIAWDLPWWPCGPLDEMHNHHCLVHMCLDHSPQDQWPMMHCTTCPVFETLFVCSITWFSLGTILDLHPTSTFTPLM
jgi:hypothetical protein